MENKKNFLSKNIIRGVAVTALLSIGQVAVAAKITVRVVDSESLSPISGAMVCIGSKDKPMAYGTMRTNSAGEVVYANSPKRNYTLTAAGDGHGVYSRQQIPRKFDIIHLVSLNQSGVYSHCLSSINDNINHRRQSTETLQPGSTAVTSHSLQTGMVDVSTSVSGVKPTHIRVSTAADFTGSVWLPYRSTTSHSIRNVLSKKIYVQVKRQAINDRKESLSLIKVGDLQ